MDTQILFIGMLLAFCVSLVSICAEKRKRNYEIWKIYLREFRSQIEWLRFSTNHEGGIPAKNRQDYSFRILNEVFERTKFLIGSEKDKFLSRFKLDADLVKIKVKEKYQDKHPPYITDIFFKPYEKIEYEITAFCEKYKHIDIIEFASDPVSASDINRLENMYQCLFQHFDDKIQVETWLSGITALFSRFFPKK